MSDNDAGSMVESGPCQRFFALVQRCRVARFLQMLKHDSVRKREPVMEREQIKKDQVFSEIWYASQLRRAEDMSACLRAYFRQLRNRTARADDVAEPQASSAFEWQNV